MRTNNDGVTTENKSTIEMKDETVMNERIKQLNDWINQEKAKRLEIAKSSSFENNICPICGREMDISEWCNGAPLVNANVCNECDKRYVSTFRRAPICIDYASTVFKHYMEAELMIEFSRRVNSVIANHSDVA